MCSRPADGDVCGIASGDPINGTDPSGTVPVCIYAPDICVVGAKTIGPIVVAKTITAAATVVKLGGSILKSIFGGGHSSPKPPQNATTNPSSTASGGEYNPATDSVSEIAVQASSSSGSLAPRIVSLATSVACSIGSVGFCVGIESFEGVGGLASGGFSFDLTSGQTGAFVSTGVGIGTGGGAFYSGSIGAPTGISGSITANIGGSLPFGLGGGISKTLLDSGAAQVGADFIKAGKSLRVGGSATIAATVSVGTARAYRVSC